jgi:hypothetical protein
MGNMGWDEGGEYGEGTMGMGVGEMSMGYMREGVGVGNMEKGTMRMGVGRWG